ncbi:MAG: ferredoxin [Elusimicrobia bacterium HGW-Elusimicrobia-2]|nr:MAG: ferredoxin [Elusimicrobia bacterium HGW-Elusimicrobia-2]
MTTLSIDGKKVRAKKGSSVLEAALGAGIYIPNLCYHPEMKPKAACRLCVVEIDGLKGNPASCSTLAAEGMTVITNSPRLKKLRQNNMWLIQSEFDGQPDENTALKKVADMIGETCLLPGFNFEKTRRPSATDDPLFTRDMNKCILCGKCVEMCREIRKASVIGMMGRGINTCVNTSSGKGLMDSDCRFCLACVEVCPTGALRDKIHYDEKDREKTLLPCTGSCPAGIEVSRYVKLIAGKNFREALDLIREKVPFPHTLGCVCTHPCEEKCRRGEINSPISIRELKKFVAEKDNGSWRKKLNISPDTGRKAAIVGSGPAGLSAAWFLRLKGHSVTVFEKSAHPGGMMRTGIPEYRLPSAILGGEIREIKKIGVQIKCNTEITSAKELLSSGFNSVFLAPGTGKGTKMPIQGSDLPEGVTDGISLLGAINTGEKTNYGKSVTITGGGNVAIDSARCVLRTGAEEVTILYRRGREEMPAAKEEIEEALKEGIKINFLTNPLAITRSDDKLTIKCVKMALGDPDESGRKRPVPVEGSEFTTKTDTFVFAIGQKTDLPETLEVTLNKKGLIEADTKTLSCGIEGVFAGGDAVSGPATVIDAIQAGRHAASEMDKFMGGDGQIDYLLAKPETEESAFQKEERFAFRERTSSQTLPVEKRLNNFSQVELCFNDDTAVAEAKRCLDCRFRLKIKKAPLPPEK